jgi:hypothetical protein
MKQKIIAVCISIGIICIITFVVQERYILQPVESLDAYALEMVTLCADSPHRPTCYESEVPKLTSEITSKEIFEVIRLIRGHDPEYLFCHVLAHELGVYDMSLDPENWLDVLAKAPPDGLCSNGYTHGAAVARFSGEVVTGRELAESIPDFSIACEAREGWNPTELQKSICYHGLGHVLVHLTDAEINPSLEVCEVIALKDDGRDYRNLCVEGIYMQLFQPLEPEDYALIDQLKEPPTHENIKQFCTDNSNNDVQYGTCWREAWPLFYEQLFTTNGVSEYCESLSEAQGREQCYISAFTINGRHNLGNPESMAALCNSVQVEQQGVCFARGANAFPEENNQLIAEAVAMCGRAEQTEVQNECYSFLARTASFNFHVGSESFNEMCATLPEKWGAQCRR